MELMSGSCANLSHCARTEFFNLKNSNNFIAPVGLRFHRCYKSKCELSRRGFTFSGIAAAGASAVAPSVISKPSEGLERLLFKPDGYSYWTWRGRRIHYVVQGEGFPIVLIHGFGASAFHWRYNIPELAKKYKVYALDLLGFGWSEKAIIDYDALVWRDQVVDFMEEVVKEPAILVGNSLGGFTALVAAAALPEKVKGVSLLNSAGQFGDAISDDNESEETALKNLFSSL